MTINNKNDFEELEPVIHERDIKQDVHAEIIVIGAGISGLAASLSAAGQGAKTIMLRNLRTTYRERDELPPWPRGETAGGCRGSVTL
jgi:glycine/D-amino acid oxidase-like deaminating enzyme